MRHTEDAGHGNCYVEPINKPVEAAELQEADVTTLAVTDMHCPNCARRVSNALLALEDVLHVEVDLPHGQAVVRSQPGRVDSAQLIQAVWSASHGTRHAYRAHLIADPANG